MLDMDSLLSLVFLFSLVTACCCHLCLLNPTQRGSISGLNKPGSDDCILLQSPCGGRPGGKPGIIWQANGNYTVIFQKNLDHYTSSSPGYFSVTLVGEDLTKELVRIPDGGEPSLHLYTASGQLPLGLQKSTGYYVQVTYTTKNPQAPKAFYQCADVMIM